MKKTVLLCDWCPRGNRFAIGSVDIRLPLGGKRLELDLCKKHQRKLIRQLTPHWDGRAQARSPAQRRATEKARVAAVKAKRARAKKPPQLALPPGKMLRDDRLRDALLAILAKNRNGWLSRKDFGDVSTKSRVQKALVALRDNHMVTLRGMRATARYRITEKGVGRAHRKKDGSSSRRARGGAGARAKPRGKQPPSTTKVPGSSGAAHEVDRQASANSG